MTGGEDEFRPRLGRIRSNGGRPAKRYLGRLYGKMEKVRPGAFAKRARARFSGERIGRGAGIGAAIAARYAFAGARSRRVAVKIRSVRLGANGLAKARAHLSYIQRDGAGRNENGEKEKARLYGPDVEKADGAAFLEEGRDDRHQFRIILSPEDAGELGRLDSYTRDFMAAVEKDLGTRLDWVAVNHYNTDHPHVHIVLRGKDETGADLVIARNYIAHGFRKRAEELATLELGPRRDLDIARAKMQEATKERWTGLDRELGDLGIDGAVELPRARTAYDRFRLKLLTARLRHLETMGLAGRRKEGWRLSPRHEAALREAGRRGDIIRSMGEAMGAKLAPARVRDFAGAFGKDGPLIGRVVGSGAADDGHDARFLGIEGADGNQWRVEADFAPGAAPPVGAIVEVSGKSGEARPADRTIAAIAARHGGVYSGDLHEADDPSSSADYRQAHRRRLEALRRAGIVECQEDGSWRIPGDYLERAAGFEKSRSGARVRVLSWASLDRLTEANGATVLDDALEGKRVIDSVRSGFGEEIKRALAVRRQFLLANGLAAEDGPLLSVDRKALRELENSAVAQAGARLAKETGKTFAPVEGGRIEGVYRQPVEIGGRRYAMIERSKEFSLVPWREVLERHRGKTVSGILGRNSVQWAFERKGRGLGV
ncbi:DUF3363 domain-containing protein [Hyphococcus luteus]|uniref:DUF3363 domain-containing protein n=1 Tax=Hyphococcus luteus TaxID=2058213 RepID=UPI0013FD1C5A|nr:DUF3363 domain-containing protein [Marinicaulis flavus]